MEQRVRTEIVAPKQLTTLDVRITDANRAMLDNFVRAYSTQAVPTLKSLTVSRRHNHLDVLLPLAPSLTSVTIFLPILQDSLPIFISFLKQGHFLNEFQTNYPTHTLVKVIDSFGPASRIKTLTLARVEYGVEKEVFAALQLAITTQSPWLRALVSNKFPDETLAELEWVEGWSDLATLLAVNGIEVITKTQNIGHDGSASEDDLYDFL